jgi:hypothetical protein
MVYRVLALLLSALVGGVAAAEVRFAQWTPQNLPGLLAEAAAGGTPVMVVITQPDWCPGCIELDRALLRNPEAAEVAELTHSWLVLEIYGYDEPDASILAEQGISFLGTPTTLLLRPSPGDRRLGDSRQLASVVGFPDDYLARLERAASGHDAIAEAQARLREENDPDALEALAQAYLAAGEADAARRVYRSLLLREELSEEQQRKFALQAVTHTSQRLENDHRRTLAELDAWAERYPQGRDDPDFVYARAWAMLSLGERDAALELVRTAYLDSEDPDTVARYLYLAFRDPSELLLDEAELRARAAIEAFPGQAARFNSAHGRILRRLGRLEEAELAFRRAVELSGPDDANHGTYLGQLEFVRNQRASAAH